ncbi:MAG: LON peptidase substrate-binding domain-containing protein [Blastocatellia bacterium]|nr:LON peptidase substrate-binding domain-containing protein [Blastocatellia bacterium]
MTDPTPITRVIPIFPLAHVQFPGALTPLHIFEQRYRKLLKDVMESDKIFGISYRDEEGSFEGDRLPLGSVGCTVEVAVVQGLPDGRSNILCVGEKRYRLLSYVEGEPYLRAEVELFDDDPVFEDLSGKAAHAKDLFQRWLIANRQLRDDSERESADVPELPDDAQALSFIVPAYLEKDLEAKAKQRLLEMTDTAARLRLVTEILEKLTSEYEKRAAVHQVAKTNGHFGKAPKL